jgi:hypothetical protein
MKLKKKIIIPFVLFFLFLQINVGYGYFLKDDWEETSAVNQESWNFGLGMSTGSYKLKITVTSNVSIDVLLLDFENYFKYSGSNPFTYISQGSKINSTNVYKEYTTTPQITYYLIIDNTNETINGANYTGPALVNVNVVSKSALNINLPDPTIFILIILIGSIAAVSIYYYINKKVKKKKKEDSLSRDEVLALLKDDISYDRFLKLNVIDYKAISVDYLQKIDQLEWDEGEKEEFIKEMLSYPLEKRDEFLREMLEGEPTRW